MAEIEVMGISLSLTWFLIISAVTLFFLHDYWCRTFWARNGIPSPPSVPVFGNNLAFRKGIHVFLTKNRALCGKVFGMYMFRRPVMVVSDLDCLRAIMVKDFSNFYNRRRFPLMTPPLDKALTTLTDERWKDVRNVMTPAFSAAKLKFMTSLIHESADKLVQYIGEKQEQNGCIECTELYGSFVMDTVATCAFGLNVDSLGNQDDPFVSHAKRGFKFNLKNPFIIIASIFPMLAPIIQFLNLASLIDPEVVKFFAEVTATAARQRKESQKGADGKGTKVDFLQLIADAQDSGEDTEALPDGENDTQGDIVSQSDDVAFHRRNNKKNVQLTADEMMAQGLIFFLAGYETTNTLLSLCSYLLATHRDVQDRLLLAVDNSAPTRDEVTYNSTSKMPYLEQVLCESLRIYPPAVIPDRVCKQTYHHENIIIPAGLNVFINIYGIHHDPNVWPDPDTFDPDRFSAENREKRHPLAWIPFGTGPRNCIGMRFALMEAKMALVRVLQKFRFETCPKTEIPPELGKMGFLHPPNGVTLRAVPRQ